MRRDLNHPIRTLFLLLLAAVLPAFGVIRFEDFSTAQGLALLGDAGVSGRALRLTTAQPNRSGAFWFREKQPLRSGFETTFQFQLTGQGGFGEGADGFAFVMQNAGPAALGGRGSAGGFAVTDRAYRRKEKAIPWSVAVFFDTFQNGQAGDPSSNFIALCTYGKPSKMRWPAERLAFTNNLPVQLKDGQIHNARIAFRPPVLSVFLDGSVKPVLEAALDVSVVMDQQGSAWVGFTASTGAGYENHDILNWSFSGESVSSEMSAVDTDITFPRAACLPDRNLCTPERAIVEASGAGYHIVLPANLEWGASVPNVAGREFTIENAHGFACWDFQSQGSQGCGNPSGNGTRAGTGFLAEEASPGALIMRTRGDRIWLSVNDRIGAAFKDNEGFYEFDLVVK